MSAMLEIKNLSKTFNKGTNYNFGRPIIIRRFQGTDWHSKRVEGRRLSLLSTWWLALSLICTSWQQWRPVYKKMAAKCHINTNSRGWKVWQIIRTFIFCICNIRLISLKSYQVIFSVTKLLCWTSITLLPLWLVQSSSSYSSKKAWRKSLAPCPIHRTPYSQKRID